MNEKGQIIIYSTADNNTRVEVKLIDNNVWMSQDQIVSLYQSSKSNISEHIKHILEEGELDSNSVVRNFRITAADGKIYNVKHYNLDMIIAIGYRVRSNIGTNFRKWATNTLNEYMTKGFALNDNLLKEAGGGRYFKELLARIRDIRSSEKVFWRQVLDIFATSVDYDPKSEISINFFKTVQNKMHWAAHGHTAAEIINERIDADLFFQNAFKKAKHSIYIIDDYINVKTLYLLKSCNSKVKIIVFTDNKGINNLNKIFIDDFKKDSSLNILFKENRELNDRLLIVDFNYKNEIIYHLGQSIKDCGNSSGGIDEIKDKDKYRTLITKMLINNKDLELL